ncbi:MAG: hypothetical protein ACJ8R9_18910 [Steroidobacteraceae bacterium]
MRGKQRIGEAAAVTAAALRWLQLFLQNDISTLSAEKLAAWTRWSANARHLDEFRRLKQLWHNLPRLADIARPTETDLPGDKYDGSESIAEWLARERAPPGRGHS